MTLPSCHMTSILDHVTSSSSLAADVVRSESPPKEVLAREKELMQKHKVFTCGTCTCTCMYWCMYMHGTCVYMVLWMYMTCIRVSEQLADNAFHSYASDYSKF